MSSYETDIYHFSFKEHQCNQAILIPFYIKYNPIVPYIIGRIKRFPDISKAVPICLHCFIIPVL